MKREMPTFISYCWHLYQTHLNKYRHAPIHTDDTEIQQIAGHNTSEWDIILERHFAAQANDEVEPVTAGKVQDILKYYYPTQKSERDKLRDYFLRKFDTELARPRIKGRQVRAYAGVFLTAGLDYTD